MIETRLCQKYTSVYQFINIYFIYLPYINYFKGGMMKHIKDKTGVIMKAIDGKDGEKRLKILIGGTAICKKFSKHL